MLRNEDEDQLNQLLSQTYANCTYMDKQIQELLTKQDNMPLRHIQSSESIQSSNHSEQSIHKYDQIVSFELEKHQRDLFQQQKQQMYVVEHSSPRHIFHQIYQKINLNLKADTIESVRLKYPLFLLSQPTYQIKDHAKSVSLSFSGNLLRKNILVMDVGYCQQQKVFKVAVGTDEGSVVIFEPSSSKPQHIIECFSKVCTITCVKWSKNLQYLAISNDQRELNVYCFKQPITIQNNITFRILKTPTQHCSIAQKLLKNMITQLHFISENPFKMIIVDQSDQIFKFQMKKHFISTRPSLTTFSIRFAKFLDLNFHTMKDSNSNIGVLMAVSNSSLITFCQIEPSFELAMVFDKQKHGSTIKKSGFPHVSFRSEPNSVLVIWDKYLQIMSIEVQEFHPFKHRFSITHKYLLPDSTIIGGFLSNTFIYQLNRVGIKIYSTTAIQKDINHSKPSQVYFQKINFQNFCYGDKIEQFISNQEIQIPNLRYLKGLFKSTNRNLFYCTNKGVQIIYFNTLQQYVNIQVQNNNWKIALQILKDCYLGKIHELDQIHHELMQNKIKQLSSRYINFLQTIIISHNQGKQNADHMELLWNQQLIFIFNILIATDLELYLLQNVLHKINQLNQSYVQNIIPFVMINKINKITNNSLELLIQHIPIQVISRLIFNMQTVNNDLQLPHQINNLLIKHELYLEFIDLNQKFKDFYTPLAVLVGIYLRIDHTQDLDIFQSAQKKSTIGKLIAYSVYETLTHINFNKNEKQHSKNILDSIIRLLMDQIFAILVREEPIALFQNIIEQLYMGNCLEVLNQLDVLEFQGDLMKTVIQSISYQEVIASKCQKRYWVAIFKLYSRKMIVDLDIYEGLRYLTIQDHIDKQFINKFVAKCEEQIRKEFQTIPLETVQKLFESLLFTPHISLVIMIGTFLQKYITTLDAMLSDATQRNQKIYDFIYGFIKSLSPSDISLLRQLFKQHIKFFIQTNAKKACDIICRYYLADLNIFVDDLNDYPLEQIKLIRSVLQLYSYGESLIDLKVRYLELLASNQFHDVILIELKKQNYPLDESLHICKKYDALQALAYLLVKSGGEGNTDGAIRVYFKIISQKIQKIVTSYHGDVEESDLQEIIICYVKKCIKICQDLDLQFHHHYENQWFVILQELQLLKKSILRSWVLANNCEMLKNIINKKAYPELVQCLISQIQLEQFVLYLRAMMSKFDLQALQIIIEQMMKNYLYEKRIFIIAQMLLIQTQNNFRSILYKKELQGFTTNCICSVCNEKGELLIHYGCGHENHPSCSHDVKECVLCEKQAEKIYRKRIDNVTGLRIDIYSSGLKQDLQSVEKEIRKEDKIKRMQLFEDLAFVDL